MNLLFPRYLTLAVTGRCNARCCMCSIWESEAPDDPSLSFYEGLLASKSLQYVSNLSLTGGEPTLRGDLPELCSLALSRLRGLTNVSLNTNAMAPRRLEKSVAGLLDALGPSVPLAVGISVDGVGTVHDRVRGVNGGFERVCESLDLLEKHRRPGRMSLSARCTVTRNNVQHLRELDAHFAARGIPLLFGLASDPDVFIGSQSKAAEFLLGEDEKNLLGAFLAPKAEGADYYRHVCGFLESGARQCGCIAAQGLALLVLPDATVYPCGESSAAKYGSLQSEPLDSLLEQARAEASLASLHAACTKCPTQCFPERLSFKRKAKPFLKRSVPAPLYGLVKRVAGAWG